MPPGRKFIPYRRDSRQKPLGHYIADFYCSSSRLVIEVDGDSHFTGGAALYDERRTVALRAEGVRVLRVTNLEVMEQFEGVCLKIQNAATRVPD